MAANRDPLKSTTYCGCDEGANYTCARHLTLQRMIQNAVEVEPIAPSTEPAVVSSSPAPPAEPSVGLPSSPEKRKAIPLVTGCLDYFPLALAEIAKVSKVGNDQHNPGSPLHWDRSKSGDELDALTRHLMDMASEGPAALDTDGSLHAAKVAWRALANLEKVLETLQADAT